MGVHAPSVKDFKAAIRANMLTDCPATIKDGKLVQKICMPDIATLKGKTVRKTPAPVVRDLVSIPRQLVVRNGIGQRPICS